jgi:3-hydroxyacyl-CoA dehydrogenase
VHTPEGSWSAAAGQVPAASQLPVYQRQCFPENVLGGGGARPAEGRHRAVQERRDAVWTLDGEVLIASITAKLHLIGPA